MAKLAENPIKEYEKGMPCMLGEVVGRIVGESEKGSRGYINGVEMPSIIIFATPHGTEIVSGIFYISEMTDEGMEKLLEFEVDALKENGHGSLYNGKLEQEK